MQSGPENCLYILLLLIEELKIWLNYKKVAIWREHFRATKNIFEKVQEFLDIYKKLKSPIFFDIFKAIHLWRVKFYML